jgi:DNA repair photolyase
MAPVVPGVTTRPALLEATMKAAADHGAKSVGVMVLHLEDGVRQHFMQVLAKEYPHLVDGYERLYAGKYAPATYTDEVARIASLLRARYGVHTRRDDEPGPPRPGPPADAAPKQVRLRLVR